MELLFHVKLTKEEALKIADMAGNNSMLEYMSNIIKKYLAPQHTIVLDSTECPECGFTSTAHLALICDECKLERSK